MRKPIGLFRFHRAFDVCAQNIGILKAQNPDLSLYGLYGGGGGLESVPASLKDLFESVLALPYDDPAYNYKNGDLCVRRWFKEEGCRLDFTHLCVLEWDMLFLKSLAEIYQNFAEEALYLGLSGPYQKMVEEGWPWIQGVYAREVEDLLRYIGKHEKSIDPRMLSYGIFGGCVLPRRFLERLACQPVPSLTNDEVRLSFYAAAFDLPLRDVGFLTDKRNKTDMFEEGYAIPDLEDVLAKGGYEIHPWRRMAPDLWTRIRKRHESA